jgi:hypothetical protein
VFVPYKDNVIVANQDGTRNPAATVELFTYTVNPGWVPILQESKADNGVVRHVYAYIGDNTTDLKALPHGATTTTLFDEVTFINVVEGQGLENTKQDIVVNAYGIQTNDVNGGLTDPDGVWSVITNTGITQPKSDTHAIQFGQPYVTQEQIAEGYTIEHQWIVYEDGSAAIYMTGATPDGPMNGCITYPADSYVCVDGVTTFDGMKIEFSQDTEGFTMYNHEMIPLEFQLAEVTPSAPSYTETYINATQFNPDNLRSTCSLQLNEDGSFVLKQNDAVETFPAGTIKSDEPFFMVDSNSSSIYPGRDSIYGHVYPDGTKIMICDDVYVLRSNIEAEHGCIHLNYEIRNTTAYHYGQMWCLDCGIMVKDLGNITPT